MAVRKDCGHTIYIHTDHYFKIRNKKKVKIITEKELLTPKYYIIVINIYIQFILSIIFFLLLLFSLLAIRNPKSYKEGQTRERFNQKNNKYIKLSIFREIGIIRGNLANM